MSEFSDLRLRAKLSIGGASEFLGVCERTIYRYEKGESRPRPRELQAMRGLCSHLPQLPLEVAQPGSAFTFIDLFAGIGGLRAGFEAAGGQCVFTSEWDRYSRKTYAANFLVNHEFGGDIREYSADPERVPEHDVLLAGFPCQPFSIAGVSKKNSLGRPHGFLCDTQGTLFFDLAQILHHRRPAAFMLENVKNLERHDQGKTFATILNVLRNELRYEVHTRVINSEPWVPQRRERVFLVGFRDKSGFDFDDLKAPPGPGPKLGSILEEKVDAKYTLTAHLWEYLKSYKTKHASKGNGFGYSDFGPDDVTRTLSARYYKDGSEVLVRQSGGRPRRLTPRECARLMGYEEPGGKPFNIPVSDTQAYKQFGNGVVVPVVKAVAQLMRPHIMNAVGQPGLGVARFIGDTDEVRVQRYG